MSAESPRRVAHKGKTGHIVLPQSVNDPSLIDSVAGFIQDVVPQAYSGSGGDSRETITWARVQQADINDPAQYPDTGEQDGVPPLLLVLGYGSGVQVWSVPVSGEAREVLSWSQGVVRTLCVLPNPEPRLPLRQDLYRHKRPLVAMVDNAGPGPQFCAVTFISLRDGDQVKSIKFSHQVWDVVANRRSVVITLAERIAVFDSATLEDNLVVTTCYPSPDINPVALGTRWLAYADRRLVSQWRSLGGCHAEGPQSVTATVFHAAKCLGKGLRELSGTVASSLTGSSPENTQTHTPAESYMKGVVTILDIETKVPKDANEEDHQVGANRILAHFNAHFEPIVALSFDPSGMLLVSADKRGHRFHVFRINPHPCGPTLAYVQHLYVLHRGDTSARIQDIAFSADSRWLAISSMRGTTHVFPITTYGGPVGVRTHTTPHVVNKLSRFHRSAGLTDEGRGSPVLWEGSVTPPPCQPAPTPTPTIVTALAQIRRHSGLSNPTEDSIVRVAACFGAPRAPTVPTCGPVSGTPVGSKARRTMDSLYIMACNGSLIQYDLEPRHLSGISKEKVCDDTGVELLVDTRAEWLLQRPPYNSSLHPPLSCTNPLLSPPEPPTPTSDDDERWLSQVEIVTHAGPHRRLWMGPQFTFITLSGNNEAGETLDINKQVVRSNPVNMPLKHPLIIESGSCSSLELSPNMVELVYKTDCSWSCRLREDLAEAMLESPATRNTGVKGAVRREPVIERQVNPIGSVVTLTAQLNFPAELRSNDRKVTVVGTETKKITLESRLNKSAVKPTVSECLMNERVVGPKPIQIAELSDSNFDSLRLNPKTKQQNRIDLDLKSGKKVLAELDDNISAIQKTVDEADNAVETLEKRGKNGKAKRKVSKGEKNKIKNDAELTSGDELLTFSHNMTSVEMSMYSTKMDMPFCDSTLQGTGDIEMQLREASLERDYDDIFPELEDCKGRKRSLDTTIDFRNAVLSDDHNSEQISKNNVEEVKENHKTNSRHRKKSRMNDQDNKPHKNLDDDKKSDSKVEEKQEIKNSCETISVSDVLVKADEKGKVKKKKSKKSANMGESVCEESQVKIENNYEVKKADDSNIETLMLEMSQETLCPESCQGSLELEIISNKTYNFETFYERNKLPEVHMMYDFSQLFAEENEKLELNSIEERNCNTDDELKGFESDLLVKDCSWSPEKEINRDLSRDEKDSDKEIDKIKNDETTDKDSSDDCQPVVVKSDFKVNQKRGKNRKMLRKNRDADIKVVETETIEVENYIKEDLLKSETISSKEVQRKDELISKDDKKNILLKLDSEDDIYDEKNKHVETKSATESFHDLKVPTDGVKRRIRQRETLEQELETKDQSFPDLDIPKISWSSIVSSNFEDPNGNISKPDEPVAPIRSWSSIAAGPAKTKPQDTDVTKTNSLEDRDSVYESCNDSVGEEVEPTLDSLGSCYFELETKEESVDHLNVSGYFKEVISDSTNGSSVEDKSNTDSGEKDDLIVGIQTSVKKSKKQKKKKR